MIIRKPRYSVEEFARRGQAAYQGRLRDEMEPAQNGRIVAIDIETGEHSLGDDVLSACEPLIAKNPDSQLWTVRVGYRAVHRIGSLNGSESTQSTK